MNEKLEEVYGKRLICNLFTQIWFGNWKEYETIFREIPASLRDQFSFHKHYEREEVSLWYENYFLIPGKYYVPPYISFYAKKLNEDTEKFKQELLCLIGVYEKVGFYYPIEKEEFPDHIGILTAFLTASIQEEIKAIENGDQKLAQQIKNLQQQVIEKYILPYLEEFKHYSKTKIHHLFFTKFIEFYCSMLEQTLVHL
ncbi:molecular chaperone TorD family protein [Microaerobacter geothermalis]|uniref:molecular chaperone TorD family protein n=1 Tax=Microaerobacter geothermalis TaxID=674972 RepID=UPI001F38729A|nr:molecular chaperone TorD family protein [Microaerobacter geothermalis]MCF6092485.1 molecular chaperone TorD family protein [Microaerobacter geothermalis]